MEVLKILLFETENGLLIWFFFKWNFKLIYTTETNVQQWNKIFRNYSNAVKHLSFQMFILQAFSYFDFFLESGVESPFDTFNIFVGLESYCLPGSSRELQTGSHLQFTNCYWSYKTQKVLHILKHHLLLPYLISNCLQIWRHLSFPENLVTRGTVTVWAEVLYSKIKVPIQIVQKI